MKTTSTPMETSKPLLKDAEAEDVDVHLYRSMIGSLMYLTASRPDIMFVVCACARFQVTPKGSHLHAVKRIFRYLKGQPKLGLWYPKDSPFDLEAYTDSDYAGASLDRKSTTGGCQFLGSRLISWQCRKQTIVATSTTEAEYVAAASCSNETVIKEWEGIMERVATTASSLESEQDSVNPTIYTTCIEQFWTSAKAKTINGERQIQALVDKKKNWKELCAKTTAWNEFSSTMASAIICIATNQKFNLSKYIFDNMVKNLEGGVKFLMYPRFVQVFLDRQVEGMARHKEVYVTPSHTKKKIWVKIQLLLLIPIRHPILLNHLHPNLKRRSQEGIRERTVVLQSLSLMRLLMRLMYLPPSYDPPQSGEDRMKLSELMNLCTSLKEKVLNLEEAKTAQAKEIANLKKRVKQLEKRRKSRTLRINRLRKVGSTSRVELSNDVSLGAQDDASKQGRIIADLDADAEVTLMDETQGINDDNLMFDTSVLDVSTADPVTTAGEVVTTAASVEIPDELTLAQTLIEIKSIKPKAVTIDTTTVTPVSTRLKAKRIIFHDQVKQAPASKPKIDPAQPSSKDKAMIDANEQLATRLQAEEQEQFSIEKKSRMLVEIIAKRKKFFVAQRAAEQRSKPPTKAQMRNRMCTCLKNMEVVKGSKARTKESSKRAGDELKSDKSKKQKIDEHVEAEKDDDPVEEEMKKHVEIVQDEEEITIDAIPLATKPPVIVVYKIVKEGKIGHFQLIRANGSSNRYSSMIKMLQGIDKEDLETLWKLVKAKHRLRRPEEDYERML
ncbi:hypothetical protein Tco_0869030 [Tanacetum coccineum]